MSKLQLKKELYDKYVETYMLIREHAGADEQLITIYGCINRDEDGEYYIPDLSRDADLSVIVKRYDESAQKWREVNINLNNYIIEMVAPPLGYRNVGDTAVYIGQDPKKQWKRGICQRQLGTSIHAGTSSDIIFNGVPFEHVYFHTYPPLRVAVEDVIKREVDACAFSEDFAIGTIKPSQAIYMYYRANGVGVLDKVKGEYVCKLAPENAYLFEDLEQYITCEVVNT